MTPQPGQQTIAIPHIVKVTKFSQLIEYNKRFLFFKKLCKKRSREKDLLKVF